MARARGGQDDGAGGEGRILGELARFVERAAFKDLSAEAVAQLKIRILDALGCALGAIGADPIQRITRVIASAGLPQSDDSGVTLLDGGRAAADRAAFYNGALVRYLDFNDSYLAPGETCHPSDNLAAVLAAAELAGARGQELLTGLAIAYQVECRLCDEAPVRVRGFDHTVLGQFAAAAGAAKALGLAAAPTAHAIAISATAHNALRVTRTGALSHWKGLAAAETAQTALFSTLLAREGITGPPAVFEGNKGFIETIAGPFEIDWPRENFERVRRTITKRFNAEIHSQATIEGTLELRERHRIDPRRVEAVEVETFDVAWNIIGGGEEGDKHRVRRKEEADHSLPYMVAVALLDGQLLPQQYDQQRIEREDVQTLLRRVTVREQPKFSERFPEEMPCLVRIRTAENTFEIEKSDYEGFHTRPASWAGAVAKFESLASPMRDESTRQKIIDLVANLEMHDVHELTNLFLRVMPSDCPFLVPQP